MIGGPCERCQHARWIQSMGHWCRHQERPAAGNGCLWFRCRERCPMPDGNGTICRQTGALLPAGPCREDCEYLQPGRARPC